MECAYPKDQSLTVCEMNHSVVYSSKEMSIFEYEKSFAFIINVKATCNLLRGWFNFIGDMNCYYTLCHP